MISVELIPLGGTPLVGVRVADVGDDPLRGVKSEALLPPRPAAESIKPKEKEKIVRVAVLGLRGMKPKTTVQKLLGKTMVIETPMKPFVEFDAGTASTAQPRKGAKGGKAESKTKPSLLERGLLTFTANTSKNNVVNNALRRKATMPSNTPSPTAPCFLEVLTFRLNLPEDRDFWPSLNARVYDSQYGGIHTPMLGYCGIDLKAHDGTGGKRMRRPSISESLVSNVPTTTAPTDGELILGLRWVRHDAPTEGMIRLDNQALSAALANKCESATTTIEFDRQTWESFGVQVPNAGGLQGVLAGTSALVGVGAVVAAPQLSGMCYIAAVDPNDPNHTKGVFKPSEDEKAVLLTELKTLLIQRIHSMDSDGRKEEEINDAIWGEHEVFIRMFKPTHPDRFVADQLHGEDGALATDALKSVGRLGQRAWRGMSDLQKFAERRDEQRRLGMRIATVTEDLQVASGLAPGLLKAMHGRVGGDGTPLKELEATLAGKMPFEEFDMITGQGAKRKRVCKLKALIDIEDAVEAATDSGGGVGGGVGVGSGDIESGGAANNPKRDVFRTLMSAPSSAGAAGGSALQRLARIPYRVRVYVLMVKDLPEVSAGDKPDPYLRVSIGDEMRQNRDDAVSDESEIGFYATFEFRVTLPGDSLLRVDVMDKNLVTSDSLIGSTEIDVEDRVFTPEWTAKWKSKPPVERRALRLAGNSHQCGTVDLFVEVFTEDEAPELVNITPPPPQQWELRLIIWSARDTPTDLDESGLSDLYVRAQDLGPHSFLLRLSRTCLRALVRPGQSSLLVAVRKAQGGLPLIRRGRQEGQRAGRAHRHALPRPRRQGELELAYEVRCRAAPPCQGPRAR